MEAISVATTDVTRAVPGILALMIQIVVTVEIVVTKLAEEVSAVCQVG